MMQKQKVTFVELPVFSGVVPLVSGYMEAYCRKDPQLAESFDFEKISLPVKTPYAEVLSKVERTNADIYAFSCYVWNTRLVRRLLDALLVEKPQAYYVLGGPQVMHQAVRYLSPERENVFVCNGEGERTFAAFLRTLLSPERDFSSVRSLSFYRNKELLTTEKEHRISDLSEIPSPFLEGMFEKGKYTWMLIETNRGCPFTCNYCYWGAATGSKVFKYDNERIERELQWISESGCWYLFIADANWGMLKRDVDLSRYIVDCQKQHGAPGSVYFCGSKNTPDRVAEITKVFHDAGLIACQSVALQTMNPETLRRVDRDNIKTSAYTQIQQSLNAQEIPSFVEIIWPLPGETLASFQEGLAALCRIGADCFVVYPLLLMNNVELARRRREYGLITIRDPDPSSEAEIVIQSNEVNAEAYREGVRYVYAVTSLYSLRGLWCLGRYLSTQGIMDYGDFFRAFVEFSRRQQANAWTTFCERSIKALEHIAFANTGALVHLMLHTDREGFDELLENFVTSQSFWNDPMAQFFFELDLVNRPYVYSNTRIGAKRYKFKHINVSVTPDGYIVEVPSEYLECLYTTRIVHGDDGDEPTNCFELKHRLSQLPFMPGKSLNEHFMYCQDASQRMRTLVPMWQKVSAEGVAAGAELSSV
jgi:tRNA A37 methylthiotransferase MiaB